MGAIAHFLLTLSIVCCALGAPFVLDTQNHLGLPHKYRDSERTSSSGRVRLHFESAWAFDIASQEIELPLGQKLSTRDFPRLPVHPQRARIVDASIESDKQISHHDGLKNIICVANLIPSQIVRMSGRQRRHMGQIGHASVWWKAENGLVNFEDSRNVWFLGGRAVDEYECF